MTLVIGVLRDVASLRALVAKENLDSGYDDANHDIFHSRVVSHQIHEEEVDEHCSSVAGCDFYLELRSVPDAHL